VAARRRPRLGAQDDALLLGADDKARVAVLKSLVDSGAKDLRVNAIYSRMKDPSQMDRLVNEAKFMGLRTQMTLMADPAYHGEKVDSALSASNSNMREMTKFAHDTAARYGDKVAKYSIGNEPNLGYFLQSKHPAKTYRKLYDAGLFGIRSAGSKAEVDFGELAPVKANQFIRRAVGRGGVQTSAIALHPYGDPTRRSKRNKSGDITHLAQVQQLVQRLHKQGKLSTFTGGRPGLDLTEYGIKRQVGSDVQREALMRLAFKRARKAGARQLIQYQLGGPKMAAWDTALSPRSFRRIAR
jgi:hypothetical protein